LSRRPGQVSQLVERAESLGTGAGYRSRGIARVVGGKFSLDPFGKDRHAARAEADERFGEIAPTGPKIGAGIPKGRQLPRSLTRRRRRDDEGLARRSRRDAGTAGGSVGLKGKTLPLHRMIVPYPRPKASRNSSFARSRTRFWF